MSEFKISKLYLPLFITAIMFNCHMGDAYASSSSSSSASSSSAAVDNQQLQRLSYITPTCDPLASEKTVTVHHQIKTTSKSLMNLGPLYKSGLSGRGVRVGVIEFSAVPCDPPGLQGAIIGLPEKPKGQVVLIGF